jgi:hypothetical protein
MSDKTKRRIANWTWGLAIFYGFMAYAIYYLPWLMPLLQPMLASLAAYFLLIPVAIAVAVVAVGFPLLLIVVFLGYFVDMGMSKLLGIKFP